MIQETRSATPEAPNKEFDIELCIGGQLHPFRCQLRTIYLEGDEPEYVGVVGALMSSGKQPGTTEKGERKA